MNKKNKFKGKQYVLSHITLWHPSTLERNASFTITAINDKPIRLVATTDSCGRLSARTPEEPAPALAPIASSIPAPVDNPFAPTLKISELPQTPTPPKHAHYELRWNIYPTKDGRNGGTHGYMRLKLESEADVIRALVLTRGCAQGFCYTRDGDGIMWSKTIIGQQKTLKLLQKSGFICPKQTL